MYIDIHAIQNVPPSCINRDDTGTPKTSTYGGKLRSRVSSQAWKRAMRIHFHDALDEKQLASRTKLSITAIAQSIVAMDNSKSEDALAMAKDIIKTLGFKVSSKDDSVTAYLLFIGNDQIERLAALAIDHADNPDEFGKGKGKRNFKGEATSIMQTSDAIDLALFGRMIADDASLNVDASAQVAHAISVDQVTPEYDYFTAKDDNADESATGAAMIDTTGYDSATLYRYANLNIDALHRQLRNADATVAAAILYVDAFIRSMPTGKQNSFANRTLPATVVVEVRNDQPINAVDAFENPVRGDADHSVTEIATVRLADKLKQIEHSYAETPIKAWNITTNGDSRELDEISEHATLSEVKEELRQLIVGALAPDAEA